MKTRKHIVFHGTVQGVGFRWRARNAADHFSCTGWCRNEWNGTVVMEIQGEEQSIEQAILAIEAGRFITIEKMERETVPLEEHEYSFRTE